MLLQSADGELHEGMCLYQPDWHQGVIGILASKVREKFNRPVIVFAREREGMLKGSARSVDGLHIRDLIEELARLHSELIISFGGHAMAAGLSIHENGFDDFSTAFNQLAQQQLAGIETGDHCFTDGPLAADDFSLQLAQAIQTAGPWGRAFPEPVFDGVFRLLDRRVVGGNHLKLRLQPEDDNRAIDAIAFNMTDEEWSIEPEMIVAVYRVAVNEYKKKKKLQLMIEDIQPLT